MKRLFIRESFLKKDHQYNVLDCFAEKGLIWNEFKKRLDVNVISIDKEEKNVTIHGDNVKALKSLDLDQFDIIDLDAYGIPFSQMEIIFDKEYKGIVFFTFIQSIMGKINEGLLEYLGFTKGMIKKTPALFNKNGFDKFCSYLNIRAGINKIFYVKKGNKYYGVFYA